ncbi:hypothetical protein [Stenotrophomonas sp. Y-13]|uniref:hypothetical protein n=1 Tax=Stenotrophomonas sp. Y-13 TaxID=3384161 RepID=UPI0039174ABD
MATRGRWGVTRDEAGGLASITEWPWYWRYPAGIATIALTLWFALYAGQRSEALMWAAIILGSLVTLGMMYELGCLSIILAVVFGTWKLFDILLPDIHVPQWIVFSAITWFLLYLWGKHEQKKKVELDKAIENIWTRLNRIEDSAREAYDESVEVERNIRPTLKDLELRIRRIERDLKDPFSGSN